MRAHFLCILFTFVLIFFHYATCETTTSTSEATQDPNCVTKNRYSKIKNSGTGTVLFNPTDVDKQCWSQDELALLTARMIFEDVLPDPRSLSIDCNEDVAEQIEYFKSMIESIRGCTKGRKRHILLLALTDLLGGYLHYAVLPLVKRGYYNGVIDYAEIEKIIQFYEEVKWFLRTNGQGWTKPMTIKKTINAPVIDFKREIKDKHPKDRNETCQKLLYYEHEPLRTRKRDVADKGIYFPLPFFDSKHKPSAIVVPFKRFSLRNIESKRSAYLVMKYYLTAHKCLEEKHVKREQVEKFQNNLYAWILKEVVPKLRDDKFYSAFGGILRVEATLKSLGAREGDLPCPSDEGEEEVGAVPAVGISSKRTKIVLVAILLVIIFWFVVGSCFVCYRIKGRPKDKDNKPVESSGTYSSIKTFWSKSFSRSSGKESICKCCESTISDFSGKTKLTMSNESQYHEATRKKKNRFYKKSSKNMRSCVCPPIEVPAQIEANSSMKILPSIAEMSEKSKNTASIFKRITFSKKDLEVLGTESSDNRPCAPPNMQTKETKKCPFYSEKSTSITSSKTAISSRDQEQKTDVDELVLTQPNSIEAIPEKSSEQPMKYSITSISSTDKEFKTENVESSQQKEQSEITTSNGNRNSNTNDKNKNQPIQDTDVLDYHMSAACHTSMSGNYSFMGKNIYGYDFQTSTSSDLSDDESDIKSVLSSK